jgi:hypothetical protein
MLSINAYWADSQELAGQLQFHCEMERDGIVKMGWDRARVSSMKVGIELNGLVEAPMRWLMPWTFLDDGMANTWISKKSVFLKVDE